MTQVEGYRISKHANKRMRQRRINKNQLRQVLRHPLATVPGHTSHTRKVTGYVSGSRLRVIIDVVSNKVITTYW